MINKIIRILKKKFIVSKSYSKKILFNSFDFLIKKIFEETIECLLSFNKYNFNKNCYNRYFFIKEICDLLYHIIIFISYNNISFLEIEKEFFRRNKISGLKEKNFR
ncbi:phosphoribosyl-ATP pyrophosphatase [Candidatus Carsonella ruddii]|uniref:phosphoribosyl-ATP pyrophosphatase n=1 Tax=Carsonella ruddii TaxID=114186 RepID=UPI003D9A507B